MFKKSLLVLLPALFAVSCGGGGSSHSNSSSSSVSSSSVSSSSSDSSSLDSSSSDSSSSSSVSSSSSSDSSSSSSSSSSAATVTGVFVDSAVGGIGYRTETQEGTTNADGEYSYLPGETVTFFIGELEFPPVEAKGVVTPLDIAGSDDVENQIVTNIARLLQTLDSDGDPANGISIPASAADAAVETSFDVPTAEFETNTANFVTNAGGGSTTLVSAAEAQAHLEDTIAATQSDLIGTWYYKDVSSAEHFHIMLTFIDHATYVIVNDEPSDANGQDGFEIGGYTWNLRTGVLGATTRVDTNGEWGLSHPCDGEIFTMELRGDSLLLGTDSEVGSTCDEGGDENTTIEFVRVASETNHMVGSWLIDFGVEDQLAMLTLTADGTYMMMQNSESTENGSPGIERGSYSRDADTSNTLFTTVTDTNGQWGFSHPCAILDLQDSNDLSCGEGGSDIIQTLDVLGGTLTFISEADTIAAGEVEPVVFERVHHTAAPLELNLQITNTLVEYNQGQMFESNGATMQCSFSMAEGESEVFDETWLLSEDPAASSYVYYAEDDEYVQVAYDPATGVVSLSEHDPKAVVTDCVDCTTTYYTESTWSWEATYDPSVSPVVTGEVTETIILTWEHDDSESICTGTYEMSGVLQP